MRIIKAIGLLLITWCPGVEKLLLCAFMACTGRTSPSPPYDHGLVIRETNTGIPPKDLYLSSHTRQSPCQNIASNKTKLFIQCIHRHISEIICHLTKHFILFYRVREGNVRYHFVLKFLLSEQIFIPEYHLMLSIQQPEKAPKILK